MSWRNKEQIPDELKDFGTPSEIAEKLRKASELEAKLGEKDGEISRLSGEVTNRDGEIDKLKRQVTAPPDAPPNDPKAPPQPTHFFADPDKAFNERALPIALATMNASAQVAKMDAKMSLQSQYVDVNQNGTKRRLSLGSLWSRYEIEIEEAAKTVPIQQLGFKQTWLNLFNYVKGNHLNDFLDKTEDFLEPVGVTVDQHVGDRAPAPKLNEEEARVVARMGRYGKGITAEKYLEQRAKMRFVGE